jgi:general L-amino acid transport system permease protein
MVNTIHVAVLGILFATMLALTLALARLSPNWLLSRLAWAYIELFRNTPLLLQLLFLHITFAQVLPAPRLAWSPLPGVFLSNRGFMLPALVVEPARSCRDRIPGGLAGTAAAALGRGGRPRPGSGPGRGGRHQRWWPPCRSRCSQPAARRSPSTCRRCAASISRAAKR